MPTPNPVLALDVYNHLLQHIDDLEESDYHDYFGFEQAFHFLGTILMGHKIDFCTLYTSDRNKISQLEIFFPKDDPHWANVWEYINISDE